MVHDFVAPYSCMKNASSTAPATCWVTGSWSARFGVSFRVLCDCESWAARAATPVRTIRPADICWSTPRRGSGSTPAPAPSAPCSEWRTSRGWTQFLSATPTRTTAPTCCRSSLPCAIAKRVSSACHSTVTRRCGSASHACWRICPRPTPPSARPSTSTPWTSAAWSRWRACAPASCAPTIPNTTLASRFETDSGILTFSADTGPGADLGAFARGSDLLLCEATYQEARQGAPVHLTARQAAETACRAEVPDLLLTHFWPPHDRAVTLEEARAVAGDIQVRLATPGGDFQVRR